MFSEVKKYIKAKKDKELKKLQEEYKIVKTRDEQDILLEKISKLFREINNYTGI
jgi:hypothetical protein